MKDPGINAIGEYILHDTDIAGDIKYYGYICPDGRWLIMKEVTSLGTYRYFSGRSGYNWTTRADLGYTYVNEVFIW
jgi:hypothetical protein